MYYAYVIAYQGGHLPRNQGKLGKNIFDEKVREIELG